jgi:mannose-6-phosphate isomerase class I
MDRGIDFGLSLFDFNPYPMEKVHADFFIKDRLFAEYENAREYILFDKKITDCFKMNKLLVNHEFTLEKEGFYIMIISDGSGQIQSGSQSFRVKLGDKFLIPASTESVKFNTDSFLEVILAMPPEQAANR